MTVQLRALSRDEIRQLDARATAELGIPGLLLMENAGRGAAGWLAELTGAISPAAGGRPLLPPSLTPTQILNRGPSLAKVLVLCGAGNNGGDGAVVARHLDGWGFPLEVVWFCDSNRLRGDAATQQAILRHSRITQSNWFDNHHGPEDVDRHSLAGLLANADWVVDALLGTGLCRPVDGLLRMAIEAANQSGKPILALDLPSGLDADTGKPLGVAIRACATATFAASKLGFGLGASRDYTGEITVIDIGLPASLLKPYRVH